MSAGRQKGVKSALALLTDITWLQPSRAIPIET
jgi:hypothetical protein